MCRRRPCTWTFALAAALVFLGGGGLAAQPYPLPAELPPLEVAAPARLSDDAVDALFFQGRAADALQRLEVRLEADSSDAGALWRAARSALNLGILEDRPEVAEAWFSRAGAWGEAAVAVRPDDTEVLFWAAASLGREALQHGPRTSTRLVQRVWDLTHRILELDPDHPGAHNILGKLNQEVMSLSRFERLVGRLLFSIDPLREANWDAALAHHRWAVESDPGTILFLRDLGETLAAVGRHDEAREVWDAALALSPTFPVDARFQDDVRRMLESLQPPAAAR